MYFVTSLDDCSTKETLLAPFASRDFFLLNADTCFNRGFLMTISDSNNYVNPDISNVSGNGCLRGMNDSETPISPAAARHDFLSRIHLRNENRGRFGWV